MMLLPCAKFAALIILALGLWTLRQLQFLAPYDRVLVHLYGWPIALFILTAYVNLVALFYVVTRRVTLGHLGQRLQHVERQLRTSGQSVNPMLTDRLRR